MTAAAGPAMKLSRAAAPSRSFRKLSETATSRLFGNAGGYKKADIVRRLAKNFMRGRTPDKPKKDEKIARDWLPEALVCPAIDPDKRVEPSEDVAAKAG